MCGRITRESNQRSLSALRIRLRVHRLKVVVTLRGLLGENRLQWSAFKESARIHGIHLGPAPHYVPNNAGRGIRLNRVLVGVRVRDPESGVQQCGTHLQHGHRLQLHDAAQLANVVVQRDVLQLLGYYRQLAEDSIKSSCVKEGT